MTLRWTGKETEALAGSTRTRRDQRETPEEEPPARRNAERAVSQKPGREGVAQRSQLCGCEREPTAGFGDMDGTGHPGKTRLGARANDPVTEETVMT